MNGPLVVIEIGIYTIAMIRKREREREKSIGMSW